MRRCLGFLLCLILALASSAGADELLLQVEAPAELQAAARKVESLGRGDFSLAYALTGAAPYQQPIRVILADESSQVAHQVPAWVSGFAVASEGLLVLFPERISSYPDRNLQVLVHHEVTHLLVARAAGYRPVPRWFNEGIATVAAREWGLEDRARYALAVVGKGPRSTSELDAAFQAGDRGRVTRAYALSAAFLRFLREHYGAGISATILSQVAGGMDFEEAFLRASGVPLAVAEKGFFEDEAFWSTWVPFLTSSTALWMAITALALLAIKRRRARSRAMYELWEQEERAEQASRTRQPRELIGDGPDSPHDLEHWDDDSGWVH